MSILFYLFSLKYSVIATPDRQRQERVKIKETHKTNNTNSKKGKRDKDYRKRDIQRYKQMLSQKELPQVGIVWKFTQVKIYAFGKQ